MIDYTKQAQEIHEGNRKWWYTREGERLRRNEGELLMLVVSEISEAMEALRTDAMDDKLPYRLGVEVELADAYIRLLDFSAGFNIPLNTRLIEWRLKPYMNNNVEQLLQIVSYVTDIWVSQDKSDAVSIAISSILDYAEHHNLDLQGAVTEKRAYNAVRKDHTYEARESAGGKRF